MLAHCLSGHGPVRLLDGIRLEYLNLTVETKHPMLVEFVGWECWTLAMLPMLGCPYVGDFDVLSGWVLEG